MADLFDLAGNIINGLMDLGGKLMNNIFWLAKMVQESLHFIIDKIIP